MGLWAHASPSQRGVRLPSHDDRCITRRSSGASPPVAECHTAQLSVSSTSPSSYACAYTRCGSCPAPTRTSEVRARATAGQSGWVGAHDAASHELLAEQPRLVDGQHRAVRQLQAQHAARVQHQRLPTCAKASTRTFNHPQVTQCLSFRVHKQHQPMNPSIHQSQGRVWRLLVPVA